jgi:hypothetical protein
MDFNGFNKVTYPNFFAKQPSIGTEYKQGRTQAVVPSMEMARDSRYPAYAGIMADAHFVTDYRPHCNFNQKPGTQFTTKQWMVHHATDLINLSRQREAEWSGSSLPMANTVPPPAVLAYSSPFENELMKTNYAWGIGTERTSAEAPLLFGTYVIPPTPKELTNNAKNISLTRKQEGGRNTVRGADRYIPA